MTKPAQLSLEDISRRMRPALEAFFARRVGGRAEAEDLTQEVFMRLARGQEIKVESPDAYIFQIAANLLRDRARREKVRSDYREAKRLEDYLEVDPLDPFRLASGRQDVERMARAFAELPERTRRIFTLYRIESLDKSVIAQNFGLSVRMVEVHIRRAMLLLHEKIGGDT